MKNAAERATDLLIQRITEGLDPAREKELDELLAQCPEIDVESFELAAAAIELTVTETSEALPPALRRQVSSQAVEFFAAAPDRADVVSLAERKERKERQESRRSVQPFFGWLAAAATLILAVALWPRVEGPTVITPPPPAQIQEPSEPTPEEARARLIAQADDLVRLDWTATEDPAASGAGGEVIWSTAEQRGYMTFRGLPANDPSVEQYQLWIFDAEQDERYPVDGGVFDVTDAGETVVEIDAKLEIQQPTLFAVTIEKPGGVVVSSRERLPLLAQVG